MIDSSSLGGSLHVAPARDDGDAAGVPHLAGAAEAGEIRDPPGPSAGVGSRAIDHRRQPPRGGCRCGPTGLERGAVADLPQRAAVVAPDPVQHRPVAAALLVNGRAIAHARVRAAGVHVLMKSAWVVISGHAARSDAAEGPAIHGARAAAERLGLVEAGGQPSRQRRCLHKTHTCATVSLCLWVLKVSPTLGQTTTY